MTASDRTTPLVQIAAEDINAHAARLLAAVRPTAIVSSPLQRATATARALADATGLTVTCDPDLVEHNVGTRPEPVPGEGQTESDA